MKKHLVASFAAAVLLVAFQSNVLAETGPCAGSDTACREFSALAEAGQFEKIVVKVNPQRSYSVAARNLIGQAYLTVAGKEGNTPEQEEQFCLKALEYGATSAYMGLYFIHSAKDTAKANQFLAQYIGTNPPDATPYMLLGESEFNQGNYESAAKHLKTARTVARGRSANLDWLLFKASYLSADYTTASAMLDSSLGQGKTVGDLKALVASDTRFSDMGRRNDFRKFFNILNGTTTTKLYVRS